MKIDRQDIHAALLGFLELLENTDKQASLEILELWLGQLAFLQHFVGNILDDGREYAASMDRDHARWRKLLGEQFPGLGSYDIPTAISAQISASETAAGDPVGDLAEIAAEISECVKRWENAGEEDALWYFRSSYQVHWGTRVRNLQIYLHHFH
jgi:hypothetical protein